MGSGFKVWSPGDVLTASDVNNYLMEQAVMSFADSAARTSAIGTANFEEGMISYLQDTDKIQVYNGTAWVDAANNTGAGLVHINTTSFSAVASQSFDNVFSSTYDNYLIQIVATTSFGGDFLFRLRVGGSDANANYSNQRFFAQGSTTGAANSAITNAGRFGAAGATKAGFSFTLFEPNKAVATNFYTVQNFATRQLEISTGSHTASTSFDGITFLPDSGSMTGSISIYGYRK